QAPRASKTLACGSLPRLPGRRCRHGATYSSRGAPSVSKRHLSRKLHYACCNWHGSRFRRAARSQVETRRRLVGPPPVDVRLLLQLVVRVRGLDRGLKCAIERGEVLLLDGRLERLPVLRQVLVDRGLVLGAHERSHLEEADDLLVLELGHRPVGELGRV